MFGVLHRNRAAVEHAILALVLPFVAGAINASGFYAIGTYTSHVSGTVARVGDELALGHFHLGLRFLGFALAFMSGAMVATGMVIWARRRGEARYFRGLLLEAALLAVFASVSVTAEKPRLYVNDFVLTSLLSFAMGLQNAMVTKLSGARIRTTHLTGITTDIGIEAVRLGYAFTDRMRGVPFWRWSSIASAFGSGPSPAKPAPPILRSLWHEPDFVHLRLHASIWLSFLTGAFVGTSGYVLAGHFAVLFPCAVLVVLAGYDLRLGLTESRHGAVLAP